METVLNTKKFGILPGLIEPDILQSVQALPGVESTNSIANINGGTNDQNLVLWDNIKMYHSGHFFGLISPYNPNLTNKVIVSKTEQVLNIVMAFPVPSICIRKIN
jgi:hypothetical protein